MYYIAWSLAVLGRRYWSKRRRDDVLHRKKFSFDPDRVRRLLDLLLKAATVVEPTHTLTVSSHEPDNRLLECSEESHTDYLVTGNKRHFPRR